MSDDSNERGRSAIGMDAPATIRPLEPILRGGREPLDEPVGAISAYKQVWKRANVKFGCKKPLHRRCVTVPIVFGPGGWYEAT